MSSVKKAPPRFHIGDWVKFDYGPKKVSAMIVEDRGLLGIQGQGLRTTFSGPTHHLFLRF